MGEYRKVNGNFEEVLEQLPYEHQRIIRNAIREAREQLTEESYGAAFGGFGGAFLEANEYENMADDEIMLEAQKRGLRLSHIKWKPTSGNRVSFDIE